MTAFPKTMDFLGLNAPVGVETHIENLSIDGDLPAEIEGAFFRAVPDPAQVPLYDDDTALSGDGMISRLLIEGGRASYAIRYVETERYLAEKQAGRALFGKYRNPFTDDASVAGMDRTVANTTPVWHAGRLYMTKEDGRAYRIDPHTLDTLGRWDFGGLLKSETMTAHVRIDPDTKEMFFFGYEAGGLCSRDVAYCIADAQGNLVHEQWFEVPYCGLMHDFVITENYAVFPVFPTTADLDRVKAGGPHWVHHQELESWVGIMPRHGDVSDMRWFRGPPGVSVFHMMNAFERDGKVMLDQLVGNTSPFPFIRAASGITMTPMEAGGGFERWTMDMTGDATDVDRAIIGPPGDMPRIPDAVQGRPYVHGWYLTVDPNGPPPIPGGVVGMMFNMALRFTPDAGQITGALRLPAGHGINEPVHIPSIQTGHDGWLMAVVDEQLGEDSFRHSVWVLDAGNLGAGPVAKIHIPARLRPQVHGWWVPIAEYRAVV